MPTTNDSNCFLLALAAMAVATSASAANLTSLSSGAALYNGGAINTGNASHPTAPTPIPAQVLAIMRGWTPAAR